MGASQSSKANGVAILLAKNLSWKESEVMVDEEGRFLLIKGTINEHKVTLVNIYLPNEDPVTTLEKFAEVIKVNREGVLILGGDMNMVWDPTLDSSRGSYSISNSKLRKARTIINDLQLVDSWRALHAHERDYSFYSHKYKTYTRIDYLFLDQKVLMNVREASIGSITISDHAPVSCLIEWGVLGHREWTWRLNETLIKDPEYEGKIKQEIESFFERNKDDEISPLCKVGSTQVLFERNTYRNGGSQKKNPHCKARYPSWGN